MCIKQTVHNSFKDHTTFDFMDAIKSMTQAKAFAAELGWTKADGERAFKHCEFPIEKIAALNQLVKFAGPELLNRQRLQGAQKAQVTRKKNEIQQLEQELVTTIDTYEEKLTHDRSQFIAIIKTIYGILRPLGYRDQWVEALIQTYESHLNNSELDQTAT